MFKDATLFFSQESAATIAHVIPTMDKIDGMLTDLATEPLCSSIKHALTFARSLMNKYYSKTDASNVYRIAMGKYYQYNIASRLMMSDGSPTPTDETEILSAHWVVSGVDSHC